MTECEVQLLLVPLLPEGYPSSIKISNVSSVMFREVRWAKRKHRARHTSKKTERRGGGMFTAWRSLSIYLLRD